MMPLEPESAGPRIEPFLDSLSDAVLVLDDAARILFANAAALRQFGCESGWLLERLEPAIGGPGLRWVQGLLSGLAGGASAPTLTLPDGRTANMALNRFGAGRWALSVRCGAAARGAAVVPGPPMRHPASAELLRLVWEAPFPALLQGPDFRLLDVNPAFVAFTGFSREALIGIDPIDLAPEHDRAGHRAVRARLCEDFDRPDVPPLLERRLIDADGRERWAREARQALLDDEGRLLMLVTMQDCNAEHLARESADRSARELDDWFNLSPAGMVLFDQTGLLVRTNRAFDELVEAVPVSLSDAGPDLQQLLAFGDGHPLAPLEPGANPLDRQAWLPRRGAAARHLHAVLRCYETPGGQRRYMAVVEDRSMEDERDLAQVQLGAMMDTVGVGLAMFRPSTGWLRQGQGVGAADSPGSANASAVALRSIGRDMVLTESLPEFEKLQHALRHTMSTEARYAIRHPELGLRWLVTRVEPATLASGDRTTSVVTLDVTEQQRTEQRSEQLLHELTTILESTSAGIAYVRADVLVRCNRRFERMLGLSPGSAAGCAVHELFARPPQARRIVQQTLSALANGVAFETEFLVERASRARLRPARPPREAAKPGAARRFLVGNPAGAEGPTRAPGHRPNEVRPAAASDPDAAGAGRWYALSVRRTGPVSGAIEAIAVLSDITRLKAQQRELEVVARDRELMFSLSEVGIAFVRDAAIQRANEAFATLAGYPATDIAGLALAELFANGTEFSRQWAREDEQLRRRGRWSGERQLRRRDGQLLWVQVSKKLVVDGDPGGGMIASYVNVDARHRAEQAVALQAERTRAILDSVLVGIVTVGARGIEWMNRSARRMFGGDLADFINQPLDTVATTEPDHPFRQTHYLNDLFEGQAETFECRVKARDGRVFWVVGNVVATGVERSGRQLTYALLDIERRRQAEARSEASQASLQRVIELAPLSIALRDARTLRVIQLNQAAAGIVGRPVAELVGCAPEEMHPAELAAAMRADMRAALTTGSVTAREYTFMVAGEPRRWDARYLPLGRPGEPADQLLLVATDVTEQRAAQAARLEAAIAQREMLVKEVHHRIKNNLQGVAGLLQQIAARKPEVEAVISEVVGQVQAIAQVYGLQVGAAGPLLLRSVLEAIARSVQRTFGRAIVLKIEGDGESAWALPEAESIPIALTINELLTNAIKHSRGEGAEVQCTLACGDEGALLTIANTGMLGPDFSLTRVPGGVSGLGLVRALIPRRSATLAIAQHGDRVLATVSLMPPGIARLGTA